MRYLNFESNKNLMALRTSNSFGDQIIAIVDISQNVNDSDSDFPFFTGKLVDKIRFYEGNHIPFTEKEILKRAKL